MSGVVQDSGDKDPLFFAIVKEIFDRFQFVAGNNTWVRKQLVHNKFFKLFLAFNQSYRHASSGSGISDVRKQL